jgi:hypothetical protein
MAGQRIELPPYSMFAKTSVYEVGGEVVFGLRRQVVVPDATDILIKMPSAGVYRLDLIADQYLGMADLWWVIAEINNMPDPLVTVDINTELRIPTRERLASLGVLNV